MLLPRYSYTVESERSIPELLERLNREVYIDNFSLFKWIKTEKSFVGLLKGDGFKLYRRLNYRNSFLPIAEGRMSPSGQNTRIDITMKMVPFASAFMLIWLGFALAMLLLSVTVLLIAPEQADSKIASIALPLLMVVGGFCVMHLAFNREKKRTEEALNRLLEVKKIESLDLRSKR